MKLDVDRNIDGTNRIHSYAAGSIIIADTIYKSSLILTSEAIIDDWQPENISQLTTNDLDQIIALDPELVVLGTGVRLQFPEPAITMAFHSRNIGLEVMDTGAACRAFNFLAGDGRKVAAALFIID